MKNFLQLFGVKMVAYQTEEEQSLEKFSLNSTVKIQLYWSTTVLLWVSVWIFKWFCPMLIEHVAVSQLGHKVSIAQYSWSLVYV